MMKFVFFGYPIQKMATRWNNNDGVIIGQINWGFIIKRIHLK